MEKKKILIITMTVALIIMGIIIFIYSSKKSNNEPTNKEENKQENIIENEDINQKYDSLEEYINSDDGHNLSSTLAIYGHEMLNNNSYLKLRKNGNDTYFATKKELLDLGYDLSLLDRNCTDDTPILYFYVDENGQPTNDINEVMYTMSCTLK